MGRFAQVWTVAGAFMCRCLVRWSDRGRWQSMAGRGGGWRVRPAADEGALDTRYEESGVRICWFLLIQDVSRCLAEGASSAMIKVYSSMSKTAKYLPW